mmetsp:Transcript_1721/g.4838  ORF Transcript_1721/g.4838 Transcript_1721/m.4838 type:complete len:88 (+) Transcript_1721:236-499(+)
MSAHRQQTSLTELRVWLSQTRVKDLGTLAQLSSSAAFMPAGWSARIVRVQTYRTSQQPMRSKILRQVSDMVAIVSAWTRALDSALLA